MEELNNKKRLRVESEESEEFESEIDFPEVKRLREDLLDSLDDETDFCPTSQDLDSFMKSFEKEIRSSSEVEEVVDLTSDSGESQPELGYLFEASDYELGLPPSSESPNEVENEQRNELVRVESDSSELSSEFSWLDGEVPSFNSFEFGFVDTEIYNGNNSDYVAMDGLFDYSDMGFGSNILRVDPEHHLPAQF